LGRVSAMRRPTPGEADRAPTATSLSEPCGKTKTMTQTDDSRRLQLRGRRRAGRAASAGRCPPRPGRHRRTIAHPPAAADGTSTAERAPDASALTVRSPGNAPEAPGLADAGENAPRDGHLPCDPSGSEGPEAGLSLPIPGDLWCRARARLDGRSCPTGPAAPSDCHLRSSWCHPPRRRGPPRPRRSSPARRPPGWSPCRRCGPAWRRRPRSRWPSSGTRTRGRVPGRRCRVPGRRCHPPRWTWLRALRPTSGPARSPPSPRARARGT
jgi:hypothetical protein